MTSFNLGFWLMRKLIQDIKIRMWKGTVFIQAGDEQAYRAMLEE